MSIILGLDPGTRITGFGLLRVKRARGTTGASGHLHISEKPEVLSYGVISMPLDAPLSVRLRELAIGIRVILQKYRPDQVSIEKIFLGKNTDSAFKLGHARGVLMAECALANTEIKEYATRLIKKSLTGKGSASKEDVNRMVAVHLGLREVKPMDASDALAMALHHSFQLELPDFKKMLEGQL